MIGRLKKNRDLLAVAILAAVGLIAALAPLPNPLRAILAAPLVLMLPGYPLSVGLFPARSFPAAERALLTFVLSIAGCVLPGLVVQIFFDLTLHSWVITLAVVTWAAVVWAAARRWEAEPAEWVAQKAKPEPASSHAGPRAFLSAALLVLALAVAGTAIAISADSVTDQEHRHQFASLWAVPEGDGPDTGVKIGVWNHDEPIGQYRLTVDRDGERIREFALTLDPDDRWVVRLPGSLTTGDGRLVVTLTGPGTPERRVALQDPLQ